MCTTGLVLGRFTSTGCALGAGRGGLSSAIGFGCAASAALASRSNQLDLLIAPLSIWILTEKMMGWTTLAPASGCHKGDRLSVNHLKGSSTPSFSTKSSNSTYKLMSASTPKAIKLARHCNMSRRAEADSCTAAINAWLRTTMTLAEKLRNVIITVGRKAALPLHRHDT
jgi:F0F1-type ATP synthase membrane subunit c/vacuolar-type H+-ATPase subunit K